jgi:hypothetical protein
MRRGSSRESGKFRPRVATSVSRTCAPSSSHSPGATMKLGSSRGMNTKRPRGSERSKPRHEMRLTRRSQPPYPWPPEQAQPGVPKPCRTTRAGMRDLNERQKIAYEIVADKRTGKSSADNLKRVCNWRTSRSEPRSRSCRGRSASRRQRT